MSDQPDLIGLKMGEFQQKNEDAEKLCKKNRGSYLVSTEKNHAEQPTQRPNIYRAICVRRNVHTPGHSGKKAGL